MEIWKDICTDYVTCSLNGWNSDKVYHIKPIYEVSNNGKIRNKYTKKLISIQKHGRVTLSIDGSKYYGSDARRIFKLNRIIYSTFVEKLDSETIVTKEMIKNI